MTRTIYKYPVNLGHDNVVKLANPEPRHVDCQGSNIYAWIEHDPDHVPTHECTLTVVGTGHPSPEMPFTYLASFQQGPFVWHAYAWVRRLR